MARKRKLKAIDYIREGWCRYYAALDKNKRPIGVRDSRAAEWCSNGAIFAAYPEIDSIIAAQNKLASVIGVRVSGIPEWNNDPSRTKRQVLAAFRKAGI